MITKERAAELFSLDFYIRDSGTFKNPDLKAQDILDLIELAAYDLKSALAGELRYRELPVVVDLTQWGKVNKGVCFACLASIVFLQQTGTLPVSSIVWGKSARYTMEFLDGLRHPNVSWEAVEFLELNPNDYPKPCPKPCPKPKRPCRASGTGSSPYARGESSTSRSSRQG